MPFYVYMIITNNKGKLTSYVGYTSNLKNRLIKHNTSKGAKFTKGKKWEYLYVKEYKTKLIAMREEYKLKKNYKLRKNMKLNYLKK